MAIIVPFAKRVFYIAINVELEALREEIVEPLQELIATMRLHLDFATVVDSMVGSDIPGISPHLSQIHLWQGIALRRPGQQQNIQQKSAPMQFPLRAFFSTLILNAYHKYGNIIF